MAFLTRRGKGRSVKKREGGLFLKLDFPRGALLSGALCEWTVKFRPPGANPKTAGRVLQQARVQVCHHHRIGGGGRLGEDPAIRVENHRVAGADFIVVDPDAVAENEKQTVVVRAARQPPQEPTPPLIAKKLTFNRRRIAVAISPHLALDQTHQMGISAAHRTGLVGRNEDLRTAQSRQADIFTDVAVVTNQNAHAEPVRQIEHRELAATAHRDVLEGVQLAMAVHRAVGQRYDVAVVELSVGVRFKPPRPNRDSMPPGQRDQTLRARPGGNRFRQRSELLQGEIAHEPITTDAALGENHESHPLIRRPRRERLNLQEIRRWVARRTFKLHGGDSEFTG